MFNHMLGSALIKFNLFFYLNVGGPPVTGTPVVSRTAFVKMAVEKNDKKETLLTSFLE